MPELSFDEEVVLRRESPAFRRRRARGRKDRPETMPDRLEPVPEDAELMLHFFEEIETLRRGFDAAIS